MVHIKVLAQQVLAALQNNTIKFATFVNCLEQRFGQKYFATVKRWKLENCIQKSGEGLPDYAANIRHLAQAAYRSMDPEFVESAVADRLVDRIWDWEVQ